MSVETIWRALENIIEGNPVHFPGTKEGKSRNPNKPSDISMIVSGILGNKKIKPDGKPQGIPSQEAKAAQEGDSSASQMAAGGEGAPKPKSGGGLFSALAKAIGGMF